MTIEFGPVTRQTVTEQVRARLAERIASGELAPGAPVPAERTLSEQFGVARTSVREALQGLVSKGLVERRGNRMYVSELLPEVAFATPDQTEADERKQFVAQLFETRRVLELPIFELASCRATADERDAIRRAAQRVLGRACRSTSSAPSTAASTRSIANACGNPLLVEMYGKVLDALFRSSEFESLLYDEAEPRAGRRPDRRARSPTTQRSPRPSSTAPPSTCVAASEQHLANVEHRMVDDLV